MHFRRSILLLALSTPLGVALGCVNMDLRLDDHDQVTPSGRISYEIWPGNDQRRSGTLLDVARGAAKAVEGQVAAMRSAGVQPTISIEGAIAAVEGRDHQRVPAGGQVELDDVVVGPARLKLDAENLRGHLAARGGLRFFDVLTLEAIAGLGVDSTEVRLRTPGLDRRDQDLLAGFLLGGRASVRPIPLFDLYAQYATNFAGEWHAIQDTEVGAELNLTRNISVFGGYRWWSYSEEFSSGSDWELDIRGPTAGASLKF